MPQKKRKLDLCSNALDERVAHVVTDTIAEIDLEIGLRQRVAETLESRIAWALAIQNSEPRDGGESHDYGVLAMDTLAAIDAPCNIISGQGPPPPACIQPTVLGTRRPPPRSKYNNLSRNPKDSFLYIHSAGRHLFGDDGNHTNQTYLLKCPVCSRTTFTSLQGLLNHARISHKLEWGTHDECVRACAVLNPGLNLQDGIEVGLGPAGILPGLQSIFRMAVGEPLKTEGGKGPKRELGDPAPDAADDASSHLARTLGLHKDTPALAPFLGKQSVRRNIRVWDEGDIDTHGFAENKLWVKQEQSGRSALVIPKHLWRMSYSQRNDSNSIAEIPTDEPPNIGIGDPMGNDPEVGHTTTQPDNISANDQQQRQPLAPTTNEIAVPTGTRFHFVSRLVVADRSLWLPPDRRPDPHKDHTHKWMISVDSPSYAQHITTVLARLAVSTGDAHGPSLSATKPPFVVIGTANRPFLAKIELTFIGSQKSTMPNETHAEGQKLFLEHWVELDPSKAPYVALGDEQIVDVELDKGMSLMPMRTNYPPISSRVLWDGGGNSPQQIQTSAGPASTKNAGEKPSAVGYEKMLATLVDKFPMTSKDVKGRVSNSLVHKLVATPAQFKSLVMGRRKAIEWGRARSLCEAYCRAIRGCQDEYPPLSTADVFSWLADNNYSLVSGAQNRPESLPELPLAPTNTSASEHAIEWCYRCGLPPDMHLAVLSVKKEHSDPGMAGVDNNSDLSVAQAPMSSECPITPQMLQITKMPMVDIYAVMHPKPPAPLGDTTQPRGIESRYFQHRNLVSASNPQFTLAICNISQSLKLRPPQLPALFGPDSPRYPLDYLGSAQGEVEAHLAPYALLSLATKCFVRVLVEGGLESAKRDQLMAAAFLSRVNRGGGKGGHTKAAVTLLTPVHVLGSIVARGWGKDGEVCEDLGAAVFRCLARLGEPVAAVDCTTSGPGDAVDNKTE